LKENAVGYNTMRKTYIDGKEDVIQYAFRNGQIKESCDWRRFAKTFMMWNSLKKG
jgi:hypothetical protein